MCTIIANRQDTNKLSSPLGGNEKIQRLRHLMSVGGFFRTKLTSTLVEAQKAARPALKTHLRSQVLLDSLCTPSPERESCHPSIPDQSHEYLTLDLGAKVSTKSIVEIIDLGFEHKSLDSSLNACLSLYDSSYDDFAAESSSPEPLSPAMIPASPLSSRLSHASLPETDLGCMRTGRGAVYIFFAGPGCFSEAESRNPWQETD